MILTGIQIFFAVDAASKEPDPMVGMAVEVQDEMDSASNLIAAPAAGIDAGLMFYRDENTRQRVEDFYCGLTGSEMISQVILRHADLNDIPLSLAFSVAWNESRYKPNAVNRNSSSVDRGLFQLNNRSFPDLAEHQFWDPDINASHGLSYLRTCLAEGGNEIVALAMYNAGRTRVHAGGTPKTTLHYISNVLEYRKRLDSRFIDSFMPSERIIAADTGTNSYMAVSQESVTDSSLTAVERLTMAATAVFDRRRGK